MLVARAFWRVIDGVIEAAGGTPRRSRTPQPAQKLVRDPVCGTFVSPRTAFSITARGSTHYFCSEDCRGKFGSRQ
jgi:YHS domain-containing protein